MDIYNPFSLEGKTILITGASSGIGMSTAIECAKLGATLVITGRNEERLSHTLSLLDGVGHIMFTCDLTKPEDIKQLVDQLPKINGLVNNAGIDKLMPLQYINISDFEEILKVNTIAPAILLKEVLRRKKIERGASVVFTGSISGLGFGAVGNGMYTASKGAISTFMRTAALELSKKGIRVNAVCPSNIETDMLTSSSMAADPVDRDFTHYPLGRYGKPEEVAWGIVFLLSDASAFVTGTNLQIDGGYSLH